MQTPEYHQGDYDQTLGELRQFDLAHLLALANYLANDLNARMRREGNLQHLYRAVENEVASRFPPSPAARVLNPIPLQTSNGTAFVALNAGLGTSEAVSFAERPLPPMGPWFGMNQWLRRLGSSAVKGARPDNAFVTATLKVGQRMNQNRGDNGFASTNFADARMLIHATGPNGFAPELILNLEDEDVSALERDVYGMTATGAMLSSMVCGRSEDLSSSAAFRHLSEKVSDYCYIKAFRDFVGDAAPMHKATLQLWSRYTAMQEVKLGLAQVQVSVDMEDGDNSFAVMQRKLEQGFLVSTHRYLMDCGRIVAKNQFAQHSDVQKLPRNLRDRAMASVHELTEWAAGYRASEPVFGPHTNDGLLLN